MDSASPPTRPSRWLWLVLGGLLATVVTAPLFSSWWHRGPVSVVLITVDTLRADRLGCYGHPTNRTPAMDSLASGGALFEAAYCDVPWTTGSMASVMTGHYSSEHGLQLPSEKLRSEALTLAEYLHANGFQTGAVIGSFPLDSVYGLDQGFETYDDEYSLPMIAVPGAVPSHVESRLPDSFEEMAKFVEEKWQNDAYRPDEDVTDAAIRWLDGMQPDRPWFLWVHYFGPHEKLVGGVGFVQQEPETIRAYNGDVEKTDVAVGRLLARLDDVPGRQLVILHSDHGQNLGENGYVGHGMRLDEASVRIPFLMRLPGKFGQGTRRRDLARNIDIFPTVLEAVGLEAPRHSGRSLLPRGSFFADRSWPEGLSAHFETLLSTIVPVTLSVPEYGTVLGPAKRSGLRTEEWKILRDEVVGACQGGSNPRRDGLGAWHLQNPTALTEEQCRRISIKELYAAGNLGPGAPDFSSQHLEVTTNLVNALDEHAERKSDLSGDFALDPEQEEKLRSLGYVAK